HARRMRIADINGDGRADLVDATAFHDQTGHVALGVTAFWSDGTGSTWNYNWATLGNPSTATGAQSLFEDSALVRFIDIDGDGRDDIVHISTGYAGGTPIALLTTAPNPGAVTPWTWTPTLTSLGIVNGSYDFQPWKWLPARDPATGSAALVDVMAS